MSIATLLILAALGGEPSAAEPATAPAPEPAAAATAQPDQAAPAPAPEQVPAAATAPEAAKPASPGPITIETSPDALPQVKVLIGGVDATFRPSVLAQFWFFFDQSAPTYAATTTGPASICLTSDCVANSTTFRIRRAELGFNGGAWGDRVQYKITIDPGRALELQNTTLTVAGSPSKETVSAKQPTAVPVGASSVPTSLTILNDWALTYSFEPVEITVGQMRIPVSWEGSGASGKLLFPERSQAAARQFGDRRDIGLRVGKAFKYFSYGVYLFNGGGQNNLDTNNQKDFALRLEAYPIEGMMIGFVDYNSVGQRNLSGSKDRVEVDFRYETRPLGPVTLLLQSEYIRGWDRIDANVCVDNPDGGMCRSWLPSAGFYVPGAMTLYDRVQLALRYGRMDPNLGTDSSGDADYKYREANIYEVGLNGFILKRQVMLQASYSVFAWAGIPAQHQLIVSSQLFY